MYKFEMNIFNIVATALMYLTIYNSCHATMTHRSSTWLCKTFKCIITYLYKRLFRQCTSVKVSYPQMSNYYDEDVTSDMCRIYWEFRVSILRILILDNHWWAGKCLFRFYEWCLFAFQIIGLTTGNGCNYFINISFKMTISCFYSHEAVLSFSTWVT